MMIISHFTVMKEEFVYCIFLLPFVMQFYIDVFYFLIQWMFPLMICDKIHNITISIL